MSATMRHRPSHVLFSVLLCVGIYSSAVAGHMLETVHRVLAAKLSGRGFEPMNNSDTLAKRLVPEHDPVSKASRKNEQTLDTISVLGSRQVGTSKRKIPQQLILTAKQDSLEEMPELVRKNIKRTLALNPDLRLMWFGDRKCLEYIKKHYREEFAQYYKHEWVGMFRGDLCRHAVLAREGGFYIDLDLQIKVPFSTMVDDDVTFMSAYARSCDGFVLNALMASVPGDRIMVESMEQLAHLYHVNNRKIFGGPAALRAAMPIIKQQMCPEDRDAFSGPGRWKCGKEVVRMYQEWSYDCWNLSPGRPASDCPPGRRLAMWGGYEGNFALFEGGPDSRLVAWTHFEECTGMGCEAGGHDETVGELSGYMSGPSKGSKNESSQGR